MYPGLNITHSTHSKRSLREATIVYQRTLETVTACAPPGLALALGPQNLSLGMKRRPCFLEEEEEPTNPQVFVESKGNVNLLSSGAIPLTKGVIPLHCPKGQMALWWCLLTYQSSGGQHPWLLSTHPAHYSKVLQLMGSPPPASHSHISMPFVPGAVLVLPFVFPSCSPSLTPPPSLCWHSVFLSSSSLFLSLLMAKSSLLAMFNVLLLCLCSGLF